MDRTVELLEILDELKCCGEKLIRTAEALKEMHTSNEPKQDSPATADAVSDGPAEAKTAVEEPVRTITFVELRKALAEKSHDGFTEQIKALLAKYGAGKLSELSEASYPEVMADLEGLQ